MGSWVVTMSMLTVLVLAALALLGYRASRRNRWRRKLPPGPHPHPFIGNLLHMPTDRPWIVYRDWGKTYSEINAPTGRHKD